MVDYGKQKAVKKVRGEDFGKKHREGITGMYERQFIADISGRNSVRDIENNNSVKKPVKQSYSAVMRCSPERRLNGYC
jgi:hypothetical protein